MPALFKGQTPIHLRVQIEGTTCLLFVATRQTAAQSLPVSLAW
jgi:hypothetical protein